ncbi:hypothetical protein H0911_06915 [Bacillus sp. HSTU-bmb18]|uniref:hypothetical protein n=1 Tax=Bacillus sp. HSTU-bmb18 TaxID=2755318 RepID=UPI0034C6AE91|nr:hypothetical protein [Bacillus cereus]
MSKKKSFFPDLIDTYKSGNASDKLSIISSIFTIFGVSLGVVLTQFLVNINIKSMVGIGFGLAVLSIGSLILYGILWAFNTVLKENNHILIKISGIFIWLAVLIIFFTLLYYTLEAIFYISIR